MSCLSSEIQFISDFAGSVLRTEEYGYLLTELKVCIIYIIIIILVFCQHKISLYIIGLLPAID